MVPQAVAAFHELHQRIYGHNDPAQEVEFVNLRVVHRAEHVPPQLEVSATQRNLAQALKETRPAWFDDDTGYQDTPVYERILLPPEERLQGPVIIEQVDTTTVVYPGQTAWVDAAGNVIITFDESAAS
jgi:N-methylhydantoinase A